MKIPIDGVYITFNNAPNGDYYMKDDFEVLLDNDEVSEDESEGDLSDINFEDILSEDDSALTDLTRVDDQELLTELFDEDLED